MNKTIKIVNIRYELPAEVNVAVDITTDMTPNEFRKYKYEELLNLGIKAKVELMYREKPEEIK